VNPAPERRHGDSHVAGPAAVIPVAAGLGHTIRNDNESDDHAEAMLVSPQHRARRCSRSRAHGIEITVAR
jgi:hypothetical protein